MSFTDNPIADFNRYMCEQQRQMDKLPKCYECGDPITDEWCFEMNGYFICEQCLKDNHRKSVEDVIE